jgi:hypothetical protein
MNIACGGEVVLDYRRLLGRRRNRSLPRREGRWRSARRSVGRTPGTRPGSQYRVPGDEALFGRHRIWVATPNQCGRSDSR